MQVLELMGSTLEEKVAISTTATRPPIDENLTVSVSSRVSPRRTDMREAVQIHHARNCTTVRGNTSPQPGNKRIESEMSANTDQMNLLYLLSRTRKKSVPPPMKN